MPGRLIAGNWKMNGTLAETRLLLKELLDQLDETTLGVDLLVMPPFTALGVARDLLEEAGSTVSLGAQDLHWEPKGAFTGEVSGPMLREIGCRYVLVGHSERRSQFGERGEVLARKLAAALQVGLTPVLCVGESLAEREAGTTGEVLERQLSETALRLTREEAGRIVIAYEPVWAIGTGRTATPGQAEEAHAQIRKRIAEKQGEEVAAALRILYGGSVTPENAAGLLERPGIDGALVGGCSLRAADFLAIARAGAGAGRG